LREGFYNVEFHTVHGTGNGVIYATAGKLRGGNSGLAFIGTYAGTPEKIHVKISTQRHNHDPGFKPLFGLDMITLTLKGKEDGDMLDFEGTALQLPGVLFKAVLTRICDSRPPSQAPGFRFDAFSSREPAAIPDQVRDRLSLENAIGYAQAGLL